MGNQIIINVKDAAGCLELVCGPLSMNHGSYKVNFTCLLPCPK